MKKLLLIMAVALTATAAMAQGWPANYGGVMLQGFFWDSYKAEPDCSPFGPAQYRTTVSGLTTTPGNTWATMYGAGWGEGEEWQVPLTTWSSLLAHKNDITPYIDLLWLPQSGSTVCGPTTTYYKSGDNSGRGGVRAWRNGGTWNYGDGNIITNPDCMGFVPVFYFHHGLKKNDDGSDWTYTDNSGNTWTPMSYHGTEAELRQLISEFKAAGTGAVEDVVINHRGGLGTWSGDKSSIEFPSEYYGNELITWTSSDVCSDDESGRGTGNADCGGKGEWARDMDHHSAATREKMAKFLDFLKNDLGYIGFRYDYAMGFEEKHFGQYNTTVRPAFSVGEYWGAADNIKTWIKNTYADGAIQSAAFDFPLMYAINDAFNNNNFRGLKGAGLIGDETYKRYAVTFVDNHDTFKDLPTDGSNPNYNNRTSQNVLEANAFILAMPGTPCLFWPHFMHPNWQEAIQNMIKARRAAGVTNTSSVVQTKDVDNNGVEFFIQGTNGKILLQLGDAANDSHKPGSDYSVVWSSSVARFSVESSINWQSNTKTTLAMGYPVVDKPSGSYSGGVSVNIAPSSTDVTLVYTTNGNEPTASSAPITGTGTTLNFSANTTLKVGVLAGGKVSNVVTRTYVTDHTTYVDGKITIFVKADDEPNFYLWSENTDGEWQANLNGNWPGGKSDGTKYIDNVKWYYKTVDPVAADKVLCLQLNWGTDASKQSDIRGITNDVFYTLSGNIPNDVTASYINSLYGTSSETTGSLDIDMATGEYTGYVKATISGGDSSSKIIYTIDQPDKELTASTTANATQKTYVVNGAGPVTVTFDKNTNNSGNTHILHAILVKNGKIVDEQVRIYWLSNLSAAPSGGINIYVKNMTTNQVPKLFAWDANNTALNGAWNGTAMTKETTTIAGQTWYKWHTDLTQVNFLFNINGDNDKTADISKSAAGDYFFYYYPGARKTGHNGFIEVTNDSKLTTTTNSFSLYVRGANESNCYIDAWNDGWSTGWPGIKFTDAPSVSVNGTSWHYITVVGKSNLKFILNNNNEKMWTGDDAPGKEITSNTFYRYPEVKSEGNNYTWYHDETSTYSSKVYKDTETPATYTKPTTATYTAVDEKLLAEIITSGTAGKNYVVSNNLFIDYVDTKTNTLYARSDRGASFATKLDPNQEAFDNVDEFNQDDWVQISIKDTTLDKSMEGTVIDAGTLNASLTVDGQNYKLEGRYTPFYSTTDVRKPAKSIERNTYHVANFLAADDRNNLFFVDPQPNEVATLEAPIFNNGYLYMHPNGIKHVSSTAGVPYTTLSYDGTFITPADGKGYKSMTVIVKKSGNHPAAVMAGAPQRASASTNGAYTISIVEVDGPVTGVEDIESAVDKEVVAVRYYNLTGVESDKPFSGLNIVVTTYNDGSRSSRKVLVP